MHAKAAHYGEFVKKCFIAHGHILHANRLVLFDTSVWMLKLFLGILLFECGEIEGYCWQVTLFILTIYDTIVQILVTSFDGKVFISRMPYGYTVRYYLRTECSDGEFILSVTFLVLIYLKTTEKSVNTYFRLYKLVWITANTKREFNTRTRKGQEKVG